MRRRQEIILRRLHGERIEVPQEEEVPPQPGDTIQWTPGVDSLLDSLRAPVETIPPALTAPADSVTGSGQSTSRSGMTSAR